ncbi:hypothetical protein BGZ76_001257 [Entomortierella beljakovae]|nr:hypothetical protein BGZ76_001257 [Entomortierella beljakovae]
MSNYSSLCHSQAFNWENHERVKMILRAPNTDKPYSMMFNAAIRGTGFLLVHAYNIKTERGRFMCFNGHIWQEISKHRVLNDISTTCCTILDSLLRHIRPDRGANKKQKKYIEEQRNQLIIGRRFVEKRTNMKNILEYYRILYTDEVLESQLDRNPDILPVENGVIELQTGELRGGLPSDYMSRKLDATYHDINESTEMIDALIGDLFNHDQDGIQYLQRLLGYAITGRTESQVWAMFTGEGSNGKSLLTSLLKSLLGDWLVTAPHEITFKGRRATDEAHTT